MHMDLTKESKFLTSASLSLIISLSSFDDPNRFEESSSKPSCPVALQHRDTENENANSSTSLISNKDASRQLETEGKI